jgi:VanZ family protein
MKYLLILFLSLPASADSFELYHRDKQLHMAASFGATLAVARVIESRGEKEWAPFLAMTTVMALGVLKEGADSEFSSSDVAANMIGTSLGGFVCWTF